METQTPNEEFVVEFRDAEIYKMKLELIQFVKKMKSEGFLESVDFQDIPIEMESGLWDRESE